MADKADCTMLADQLERFKYSPATSSFEVDLADEVPTVHTFTFTSSSGSGSDDVFSEATVKVALHRSIMRESTTVQDVRSWSCSNAALKRKLKRLETDLGTENDKAKRKVLLTELADAVINNDGKLYCQPTLEQFGEDSGNGSDNVCLTPGWIELFFAVYSKVPGFDDPRPTSTRGALKVLLSRVLILWGGPDHGTGAHFDWSPAYNFAAVIAHKTTARGGGGGGVKGVSRTLVAKWLLPMLPTAEDIGIMSMALDALASCKPFNGSSKPPTKNSTAAMLRARYSGRGLTAGGATPVWRGDSSTLGVSITFKQLEWMAEAIGPEHCRVIEQCDNMLVHIPVGYPHIVVNAPCNTSVKLAFDYLSAGPEGLIKASLVHSAFIAPIMGPQQPEDYSGLNDRILEDVKNEVYAAFATI